MKCPSCGTKIEEGETRCSFCGAPVDAGRKEDAPWNQQQNQSPAASGWGFENPANVSRTEFYRSYATDKVRKNIRGSAILCYVCAAITAVFGIVLLQNIMVLIDVAIVLVLGLAIHMKQSRVCAILLLAYSIFSCVVTLLSTGQVTGWLLILAGVFAVINTFKFEKEYQAYHSGQ